jgi:alkylhydroperoxidase/carboxymuconolactone decarboxylase family protein YurZ
MTPAHMELLRRLALNDERTLTEVMSGSASCDHLLDDKTNALVKIAGSFGAQASGPSLRSAVDSAHAAGADDDEIVEVFLTIAPIVGAARVNATAPNLAGALGYELEEF